MENKLKFIMQVSSLFLLVLLSACATINSGDISDNDNFLRHELDQSSELKKFTFQFRYIDEVMIDGHDFYKVDVSLPNQWTGEQPIVDDTGIVFTGFTSLYCIAEDFQFADTSWENFMTTDYNLSDTISSTGITANSYDYIKYKYPESNSYFVFIKVYPTYVAEFNICLDRADTTSINEVLDSIYFYK